MQSKVLRGELLNGLILAVACRNAPRARREGTRAGLELQDTLVVQVTHVKR